MAALAAHLEAAVHAAVEARNKRWKATMWSDFLKHAVAFLLAKGRDQDDVVAAAVGLIVYGMTNEEKLQGVRQGEYAECTRSSRASWPPRVCLTPSATCCSPSTWPARAQGAVEQRHVDQRATGEAGATRRRRLSAPDSGTS